MKRTVLHYKFFILLRYNYIILQIALLALLKLKFRQCPAIHTNYSLSNGTISNWKGSNRTSDLLVINKLVEF